jgi:DNA-binding CsgD family transcriptional regulator
MSRKTNIKEYDSECAAGLPDRGQPPRACGQRTTSTLTAAERRVLNLVSLAKTNKEIAVELEISPATVKRHLENILKKFELKNRVEAAIYGLLIAGCPQKFGPPCPLHSWLRDRTGIDDEWAI